MSGAATWSVLLLSRSLVHAPRSHCSAVGTGRPAAHLADEERLRFPRNGTLRDGAWDKGGSVLSRGKSAWKRRNSGAPAI